MKRYMIGAVIGAGTDNDPYRSALAIPGIECNSIIPSNPTGHPLFDFAFCYVGAVNLLPALQTANSFAFPDYSLDGRMDGMAPDQRLAMVQSVEAYVLNAEDLHFDCDFITDAMSYRDVLTNIARQTEPAFTINAFGVGEGE